MSAPDDVDTILKSLDVSIAKLEQQKLTANAAKSVDSLHILNFALDVLRKQKETLLCSHPSPLPTTTCHPAASDLQLLDAGVAAKHIHDETKRRRDEDEKMQAIATFHQESLVYAAKQNKEAPLRLECARQIFEWTEAFRKTTQCELLFTQTSPPLCPLTFWKADGPFPYYMRLSNQGKIELCHWRKMMFCGGHYVDAEVANIHELAEKSLMLAHLQAAADDIQSRAVYPNLLRHNNLAV